MKNKIILIAFISMGLITKSFSQQMTFGFVKNCMSFERSTVTDELTKKQYFIVERILETAPNQLLNGATYYSNEKDRTAGVGEIKVLSAINGSKKITEISFINGSKNDFSKNYTEVYNQMINFYKDEVRFKSSRYKTDVIKFAKDKNYYYIFKNEGVSTILVANYKIEDDYFAAP